MTNRLKIYSKFILIVVVFITAASAQTDQEQNGTNFHPIHHQISVIPSLLVLPIQQKVDTKVKESVDMINQIIHSTNSSMDEYFEMRNRRAQEAYARLIGDIDQERVGANLLLDKMIVNSKETVINLQKYFADVMNSTMEKTYTDIKSILSSAVSKIDTVSRDIKESLKANQNEPISIKDTSTGSESVKPTSLVKLFNSGIESIKKLAFKFKNEPIDKEFNLNPRWNPIFDSKSGKSEEKAKSKKLSGRRHGIVSFAHEPFRPWPQLKLSHFKQMEERSKSEQEAEMRLENAVLEESEKRLETLAAKIIGTRQEFNDNSTSTTTTGPAKSDQSAEKIVMTKKTNGNIFNKLMNLMNFRP